LHDLTGSFVPCYDILGTAEPHKINLDKY